IRPSTYTVVAPYSQIFFFGILDFGRSAFEDFESLSAEERMSIVECNFQLMLFLDSSYRAHHIFPDDETIMCTYHTFISEESIEQFFADCPFDIDKKGVVEMFASNIKQTFKKTKKELLRVMPTVDEFIALFGFALWNDLSPKIAQLVERNREAIVRELSKSYTRRGMNEHAPRIGELFCLLANEEKAHDITAEHVQIYRMMNLFNEGYEDGR
ncbi:hypothetical protein PMAYCL1PPCAC_22233, partial [Pristionchus mayeri]